jgi:Zn-finger nucleic acid-binding protein
MTDRSGVEIDYCPNCRGVWLDRGELDKIIERSAPPPAPQPMAQRAAPAPRDYDRDYEDDRDHNGRPRKKKRDSFLSDIFDF